VTETALRQLKADLGLHVPAPGSLGRAFVLVLIVGMLVAWAIGSLVPARSSVTWLLLTSLVLWQPVVEEFLFRGVLQGLLLGTSAGSVSRWGLSVANLVTSLAFVLVHFVNQPAIWAIGVFVPSMLFGLFRDRTGSIWPPLVLHVLFNGAFFAPLVVLT
jgi:membrane protease YdiL (CAAX protease family)